VKLSLDENLPPALAQAAHALLRPQGGEAISIPERFGRSFADVDWISELHQEGGWAVLTTDRKLRTRPHERLALEQSGLLVFIMAPGWNQEGFWRKAAGVIRWLPGMIDAMERYPPPALLSVPHRWTPTPIRRFRDR
jgi:hypothetical protein